MGGERGDCVLDGSNELSIDWGNCAHGAGVGAGECNVALPGVAGEGFLGVRDFVQDVVDDGARGERVE